MIDLARLRNDPEKIIELIKRKDPKFDAQELLNVYVKSIEQSRAIEQLRERKNQLADEAKKGITDAVREESKNISIQLKEKEILQQETERHFKDIYLRCPNIPDEDIPLGFKESNKVVKEFGKKPTFNFPVKNHLELGNALGWFDFEKAALMTASNFALYKGDAVKLLYSLTMFMIKNNLKHGFELMLPPYLVNEKSLEVASNFPKFRDQVYAIPEDDLYLSPTSEVNLTNYYRNHIFDAAQLPVRLTSWTSCFRREAGGYGSTERGLIRIHQFEKVELYTLCDPAHAKSEQERMLACAENILQQLNLHYRVSLLAAQDCSFPSAKTFDIEVWLPGQNSYYEVSSCSNCTDFQARRGMIRYRKSEGAKPELVYTLNASSLALPRLMVAIMETYQQPDGSIAMPEVLKQQSLFD